MSKHLRLTNEQFLYLRHTLTKSQFDTYLFLSTLNPFADRQLEIDTAVIAEHLGITRRTVQNSLSRLNKLGLINWQVTRSKVQVLPPKSGEKNVKNDVAEFRQSVPEFRHSVAEFRQSVVQFRQDIPEPALANDSETSQTINTIHTNQTLSNCARENLGEERVENFENSDQENSGNSESEKNVESLKDTLRGVQEKLQNLPESSPNQDANKPESANNEVDQGSAAAPPRFFANLSEFVIYEAKQDPAIKSPEIWANACLRRNPEEWQAKWEKWERDRITTTTYKPEVFTPPDPDVARRAIEEARKLLPAWMRRDG